MKLTNKFKYFLPLISLIILASILRYYKLGEMPPGITNDELGYVYNGYSIANTGKNIFGQSFPFITWISTPFLPVLTYLIAITTKLFGLSTFLGRFPTATFGVLEVVLIYLIAQKLYKSRAVSFFAALMLSISPWHLQLSRSAYDPIIALFFYMFSIYLLLNLGDKNRVKFYIVTTLSLISLFLALFSYRNMNIIFIPIMILTILFIYPKIRNFKQGLFLLIVGFILVGTSYFLIVKSLGNRYVGEAFNSETPINMDKATEVVKSEISNTYAPIYISRLFINKITYSARVFRENYLTAFSTDFLFTKGEASGVYSIWWRGALYLIELPFIILGLIYLYKKNRRSFWFSLGLLLIGPIPSGLTGQTYIARGLFMLPLLSIFSGAGIAFILDNLKKYNKFLRLIVAILVFGLLFYQLSGYLFQYYARYSIYGAEAWFKSTKDLSQYIAKNNDIKIIVSNASVFELLNYAFYTKTNPILVQNTIRNFNNDRKYSINNVDFKIDCLNDGNGTPSAFLSLNTIYITRMSCQEKSDPNELIRKYNGKFPDVTPIIWKIYKSKDLLPQT